MNNNQENTQIKGKGEGQIINNKIDERVISSNIKTTVSLENGKNATTMQGGYEYPIMFKEVLAGEYIQLWDLDMITRVLTPLVPTLDKVYITLKAFFVPHSRVYKDFEKNMAMADNTETLNERLPKIQVPLAPTKELYWRDRLLARYGIPNQASIETETNVLLTRGYRAIYNDFLRVKEYEPKKTEWDTLDVTTAEINAHIDNEITSNSYIIEAGKARKSYLNNLKRYMQKTSTMVNTNETYVHLDWQNRYNMLKQNVLNAEKNDWDIIAEMGGTQPLTKNEVELLGMIDYELNYQQITQTSPIIDNSAPLGTTGSFSYTRATGELFSHKEFKQHGFIHVLAIITVDNLLERNTPKELLKVNIQDIYRPTLATKELQTIKLGEINNGDGTTGAQQPVGYQPPWEEYKRLPSWVSGEMQTARLKTGTEEGISNSQWHNMYHYSQITVQPSYFKPANFVNMVLARNNVANLTWTSGTGKFKDDPIVAISEHRVKTSLPMVNSVITSTEKAEERQ